MHLWMMTSLLLAAAHDPPSHPARVDETRFFTSRDVPALPVPAEEDAFFFAIFGDRTGGPAAGVEVLADAVTDVNLLEPDLVMTVGDLIEGYNDRPAWMVQMREFKGVMDRLACPWFPVAGNHDIYWRGGERPPGEHESDYEKHFGPLWYAFEHKDCWFVVLYSDEGNPQTGEKAFNQPAAQRMSDAQLAWLRETLDRAAAARHVFVFLHHPRWLGGGYGDDWKRVHAELAAAGNVRAVFAGHIHRMRYDGTHDGIEYVTLATTGGHQGGAVPEAGYLHHYHIVTVRPGHIAMSAVPVGAMMNVREITGTVSDETLALARLRPAVSTAVEVASDGSADTRLEVSVTNPVSRPIEVTLVPDCDDSRWTFGPDHRHEVIEPGDTAVFAFEVVRHDDRLDETIAFPDLRQRIDYLGETLRYPVPERPVALPVVLDLPTPTPGTGADERVLVLDGRDDCASIASADVPMPDGPLTLEAWFCADTIGSRVGLAAKTENSEYGLFISGGKPGFSIFLGGAYAHAAVSEPVLETGRWYHLAGVYDGAEVRLYLDGERIAAVERSGERRRNGHPLVIGADVDNRGAAVSHFDGQLDGVRLSMVARYAGRRFTPERRLEGDAATALLLNMDGDWTRWLYDGSGKRRHPELHGGVRTGRIKRP